MVFVFHIYFNDPVKPTVRKLPFLVINDHKLNSLLNSDDKGCKLEDEVYHEDVVVSDSHAVIDPRTVMIISVYTLVADNTVSGSVCPDGFAFRTQRRTIKSLQ